MRLVANAIALPRSIGRRPLLVRAPRQHVLIARTLSPPECGQREANERPDRIAGLVAGVGPQLEA